MSPSSLVMSPSSLIMSPSSLVMSPSSLLMSPSSLLMSPSSLVMSPSSLVMSPSSFFFVLSTLPFSSYLRVEGLNSRLASLPSHLEGASAAVGETQTLSELEATIKQLEDWLVSCGHFTLNQHILEQFTDHKVKGCTERGEGGYCYWQ